MSSNDETIEPNQADRLKHVLTELVSAFDRHGVRYALIGGMAVTVRGRSRFTRDVDFLVDMPQLVLPKLLEDLVSLGFQIDVAATIRAWHQGLVQFFGTGQVRVDWMRPVVPEFQQILERSTTLELAGHSIRVADVEGLILLKLTAWRPQDQDDVLALLAKHIETIDLDWIRERVVKLTASSDPCLVGFEEMIRQVIGQSESETTAT